VAANADFAKKADNIEDDDIIDDDDNIIDDDIYFLCSSFWRFHLSIRSFSSTTEMINEKY
jgi:hypothetical protein